MKRWRIAAWPGLCVAVFLAALAAGAPVAAQENPGAPRMNVLLLDDALPDLAEDEHERWNDWAEWERRLPSFLSRLRMVADFKRAGAAAPEPSASLYALEIPAAYSEDRREAAIRDALSLLQNRTTRPTAVLARGSAGHDQMRCVFQDKRDYVPAHAAKFLRILAEISPPCAPERVAKCFGPFQAPPTLILDPRPPTAEGGDSSLLGVRRWGVLEETYALPHFVLHLLAALNGGILPGYETFYMGSSPEPGTAHTLLVNSREEYLRSIGEVGAANGGHHVTATWVTMEEGKYVVQGGGRFTNWLSDDRKIVCATAELAAREMQRRDRYRAPYNEYVVGLDTTKLSSEAVDRLAGVFPQRLYGNADTCARAAELARTFHSEELTLWNPTGVQPGDLAGLKHVSVGLQRSSPSAAEDRLLAQPQVRRYEFTSGKYVPSGRTDTVSAALGVAPGPDGLIPLPSGSYSRSWQNRWERDDGSKYKPGGVLFAKGNRYTLDLSGRVLAGAAKAQAAVDSSADGSGGTYEDNGRKVAVGISGGGGGKPAVPDGPERTLLMSLLSGGQAGRVLPWGIPLFLGPEGAESLDPARVTTREALAGRTVALQFAETGNFLDYIWPPTDAPGEAAQAPDDRVVLTKKHGDFQPDLLTAPDGGFTCVLAHGVLIDFDKDGLFRGLRGPGGESVTCVRGGGRPTRYLSSTGRTLEVPVDGFGGRLRQLEEVVRYDAAAKATQVGLPGASATLQYLRKGNTLRVTDLQTLEWRFQYGGRLAGVLLPDRAILWTRSSDGRIIQLAIGSIVRGETTVEFRPGLTIGACSE